ncbi:unnamed protein product [Arabidopsis arenosa]|uniref:Uncharacterized protein n=1 Tax=Arabidopsis arenosa TaxID=38785 RepID=A0A8S2AKC2_ARAAE|nr:unnamed protein product [Arabidopsis arenosa]
MGLLQLERSRVLAVKILCLSPDALEALYYRGDRIPLFNNLISLSVGSDKPHGSPFIFWKLLPSLLNNSLNIETLTIKGLVHYVAEGWEGLSPMSRLCFSWDAVSDSLSSSAMKVLEITGSPSSRGFEGMDVITSRKDLLDRDTG